VGAQVFTREAVTLIHERSRGIPRTISVIADNALLTGFAVGQRPVNSSTVREVCRDFDLGGERDERGAAGVPPVVAAPRAPVPAAAPPGLLVLGAPADESVAPVAAPPGGTGHPSDGGLPELSGTTPHEPKRGTFSFLRG
jgi:hypothetical protein